MLVLKCLTMLIKSENSSGKKGLLCTERKKIQLDCFKIMAYVCFWRCAFTRYHLPIQKYTPHTHAGDGGGLSKPVPKDMHPLGGGGAFYLVPEKRTESVFFINPYDCLKKSK